MRGGNTSSKLPYRCDQKFVPHAVVERLDRGVAIGEPSPERVARGIRVIEVQVAAVLVVDVPHDDGRMRRIALGERGDELGGEAAVDGRRRGELLATARPVDGAVLVLRQELGVRGARPRRRRGGRRGEVDGDAALVQQVDHPVEPAEVELALARLDARPREDAEAHHRDAGLAHARDVVGPDLLGPLLGVVVGAVVHG